MADLFIHMAGAGAYLACLWVAVVLWMGRMVGAVPPPWCYFMGTAPFEPEVNEKGGNAGPLPRLQPVFVCAVSLCLLLLPAGRLPALARFPGALGLTGVILAFGALAYLPWITGDRGQSRRLFVAQWLLFATALAALAFFALRRGLPGDLGSVDSFVATPLWSMASGWGMAGLCCILAGTALCLPPPRPAEALARYRFFTGCVYLLWLLLAHGLAVSLLAPWHFSAFFDLALVPGLALDFFGFWVKVALSVAMASRVVPGRRWPQWTGIAALLAGQIVLVLDALWGG